jgi:hypothetical protein
MPARLVAVVGTYTLLRGGSHVGYRVLCTSPSFRLPGHIPLPLPTTDHGAISTYSHPENHRSPNRRRGV